MLKDWSPPNEISDKSNVCNHCGVVAAVSEKYCAYCGQLKVHTTQPVSVIHLPQISTYTEGETVQIPPIQSKIPDVNHQHDMAYKEGNRLIYDFEKVGCCPCGVVGLDSHVKDAVPWELEEKGITKYQWEDWMVKLMENQTRAPSGAGFLCMFCIPGIFVQAILCDMFCPIAMDHPCKWLPCCYGDWYVGLRKWQEDVNSVLNPHDMHVKLMTYKPGQKAPKSRFYANRVAGKGKNYEMSMMVISLTEDETETLQIESWDHGVNDGSTTGIGRLL